MAEMRKGLLLVLAGGLVLSCVGCVMIDGPVHGGLYTKTKGPGLMVDPTVQPANVGVASVKGIVGVAIGDASVQTAMTQGGITKINRIEQEAMSIMGVYGEYKTIVYGE
jgi:hypothetical protein